MVSKKLKIIAILLIIISIIGITSISIYEYTTIGYNVSDIDTDEVYAKIEDLENILFDIIPYRGYPLRNFSQDEIIACSIRYIMDHESEYSQYIKDYDNVSFSDANGEEYEIKTYIDSEIVEEVATNFFYFKKLKYKDSSLYNKEIDAFVADYISAYKGSFEKSEYIGISQISRNEYKVQIQYERSTLNINAKEYFLRRI